MSDNSSNSIQHLSLYNSSFLDKVDRCEKISEKNEIGHNANNGSHLKKKRKYSMKSNSGNRRYKKARNSSRTNPYEGDENNLQEDNKEDDELCISTCIFGRKYQKEENDMIECDGCLNWYHIKCIGMTTDEFTFFINTKTEKWLCPDCRN